MPWNTGDNDPTPGPWGSPGDGNKRPRNEGNNGPKDRGPWSGGPRSGGGPGNNNLPDLDQLIARANAAFRGFVPGGGGMPHLRLPRSGGRALLLLVLLIVAVWLATGFYRVEPDQQGVVLRFGAFNRTTFPGLNYHIPWPVETALTPSVTHINRVEVGFAPNDTGNLRMTSRGLVSDSGNREQSIPAESLMLTGDENIIDIDFAVFWRIRDAGSYLFNTRDPDETVKQVAESEMREVIGRTPIQPALTEARAQIETDVRAGMQAVLDQYKSGVEITQVQLQKVDPPADVIESFRDVQRANTDAERMRNEAESYRNDIVPRARGDAAAIVATADGARQAAVAEAGGQAQRFASVYAAYQAAKDVTLRRLYIETMQAIISKTPTTVLDAGMKAPLPLLNLGDPTATTAPAAAAAAKP
jgi:membrane protease subunit HflK